MEVASLSELCTYAAIGGVTGLVRDVMATGGLVLPSRMRMEDGESIVRLGFILSILIGAIVAVAVDHSIMAAVGWAWMGPDGLERLANMRPAWKRNGRA